MSLSCISCAAKFPTYDITSVLPRESFVKVEVKVRIEKCFVVEGEEEKHCLTNSAVGHGSGAVIENTRGGSYILTAGHVCEEAELEESSKINDFSFKLRFEVLDLEKERYTAKVIKINRKLDICIMFAEDLDRPAVKLRRKSKPTIGEKVYNLAAPAVIYDKNMFPILEGRYSGDLDIYSVYTIPAIGGSSGSPVVNKHGELVGMIHSVHRMFPFVSYSPKTKDLYNFIYSVL